MTRFSSFGGRDSRSREWRRGNDDKRYHTGRYQRFRLRVLTRDWRCFVPGCWKPGNVLDHVVPVYPGMPDDLFYSEGNARASCRRHNAARGWRTYADRELGVSDEGSRVITGDYSVGGPRKSGDVR